VSLDDQASEPLVERYAFIDPFWEEAEPADYAGQQKPVVALSPGGWATRYSLTARCFRVPASWGQARFLQEAPALARLEDGRAREGSKPC